MSQFLPAFSFTMTFECPTGDYSPVPDDCPEGCAGPCYAIAGVNSGQWPKDYAEIAGAPPAGRLALLQGFYLVNYWNALQLAGIGSQDVASRVFDEEVNSGRGEAVLLLQRAVNDLYGSVLEIDGIMGPATIAAANAATAPALVSAYRQLRLDYYEAVLKTHPGDLKYMQEWLRRACA